MRKKIKHTKKKGKSRFKKLKRKKSKSMPPQEPQDIIKTTEEYESLPATSSLSNPPVSLPNSIAFSSDMTKLYLIDCERNICFDLVNSNGVMVSTVKGQIFAVSAALPRQGKADSKKVKQVKLPTENAQFTLFYNENQVQLFVIGATDIDGFLTNDKPGKPEIIPFEIKDHVLLIRRISNVLELSYFKR